MDFLNCCGAGQEDDDELTSKASLSMFDEEPLAVNHLTSTPLYDAIQSMDWDAVDFILATGSITLSPFQSEDQEGSPIAAAEDQVETWIISDNDEGQLIWRQLPIHAAICYGAPFETVRELVRIYPGGLCCADADGNLPIHLAIKFNRSESILRLLLKSFPGAFHAKNGTGRVPLEMADQMDNQGKERYELLKTFVECRQQLAAKERHEKETELEDVNQRTEDAEKELARAQRELWYLRRFPMQIIASRRKNRLLPWRKQELGRTEAEPETE